MVEILYKIFTLLISPITWFWDNIPKYVKRKQYAKIVISFLLSLLLMAMIAFDLLGLAYIIITFANQHLWLVCFISGIGILYWNVKEKHSNTVPEQEQILVEKQEEEQLKAYARNGYRDIRLIVFRVVQTVGEALGMKHPRMLADIEASIEKFFITNGAVYYIFDIKKENINQKYTEEELEDSRSVLENTFMELWHKGSFPNTQMSIYTDNSGVILPPVIFVLLSDMGTYLELYVTFTSSASVDFIKSAKQEKNDTNNGYDNDDSRLL